MINRPVFPPEQLIHSKCLVYSDSLAESPVMEEQRPRSMTQVTLLDLSFHGPALQVVGLGCSLKHWF